MGRQVRIGIDVGGTFTKAVVLDDDTHEIVAQAVVATTHTAAEGVAAGVIEAFRRSLASARVTPTEVVFIAHSTTQATNALLEGDVAPVGVIGMGRGAVESRLARSQTMIGDIELSAGRLIACRHAFIRSDDLTDAAVRAAVAELQREGVRVIVASDAFSVDDARAEEQVMAVAGELGLPATGGHEITKLYGLTIRTRTAVINASILPKMMETARLTHESVRAAGITCPLMIMRGDGGVMNLGEVENRPILTMLSGPAASVAGALMHLRVSDGIFFEVGGTSTNIAVIRNGRPTIAARVRTSVDEAAQRILDVAVAKVVPTIERLVEEYALERDQMTLVGGGGGASALIPYAAQRLGLDYRIAENAAVISSIGVALAMVQDSVERVIPNPRPEDLAAVRAEAREAAIRAGAHPASVQVHIEVNPQTQRVRATAWGATEMRARDLLRALSEAEARAIAAQSLKVEPGAVRLAGRTGGHWVFVTEVSERRLWIMKTTRRPVRVLDRGGFIKVQRADAEVGQAVASTAIDELRALWGSTTLYDGNGVIPPDAYLVLDGQMVELSGMISIDHAVSVAESELSGCRPDEPVVIVAARRAQGRL